MGLIVVKDPLSNAWWRKVEVVAVLGGEAIELCVDGALCVVSGKLLE